MEKQKIEIKITLMIMLIIFLMIMAAALAIQNKRHKDTIEVYEEYYIVNEEMDIIYRQWVEAYQHYSEVEYYLKFYPEPYLRYLELKKIIGETE